MSERKTKKSNRKALKDCTPVEAVQEHGKPRVLTVLQALNVLQNCATNQYNWTEDNINHVKKIIQDKLDETIQVLTAGTKVVKGIDITI